MEKTNDLGRIPLTPFNKGEANLQRAIQRRWLSEFSCLSLHSPLTLARHLRGGKGDGGIQKGRGRLVAMKEKSLSCAVYIQEREADLQGAIQRRWLSEFSCLSLHSPLTLARHLRGGKGAGGNHIRTDQRLAPIAFTLWLCAVILLSLVQGSARESKQKVEPKIPIKAQEFPLSEVRLLDGPFKDAQERERAYLLKLDIDRLLHNFRVNAGLTSTAEPLSGWETPDCELRGHFTGHYLTACALMYSATGDMRLKAKADDIVAALAKCQSKSGYLSAFPEEFIDRVETGKRVWAPWYTLHKMFAGLIDMYILCDNEQALDIAQAMAGWAKSRLNKLDDAQTQSMLKTEFGGMGESLCNLYAVTGNSDYLALARRFEKQSFVNPLISHRDELKGFHANTHIPQAIAIAREYELTGEKKYYEASTFFWDQIVDARSFATGGTSNYEYWLDEPNKLADQLSAETHENCCSYNMLKLTQHLFSWSADPKAMDYYERVLFNAILPTQKPDDGGAIMYYVPLKSGLFKGFGPPDSSYLCCNGSGIESFAKTGNSIYYHDDECVYVNLFIASELNWEEKGIGLRQETQFPAQEGTTITVNLKSPREFTLRLRIPYWVNERAGITLNGKELQVTLNPSDYAVIKREWRDGDRIELRLPMNFHLSSMPDEQTMAAIMYGPLVLVGALGKEGMTKDMESGYLLSDVDRALSQSPPALVPVIVTDISDPNVWIKPSGNQPLTFTTGGVGQPGDVTLIPFYELFGERYAMYWNIYSPDQWKKVQVLKAQRKAGTVDDVTVGDQFSEREHNFQAYKYQRGETQNGKWAKSQYWLRYDLDVDPNQQLSLECTYRGDDKDCAFDILIDGQPMASDSLSGDKGSSLIKSKYPIPPELTKGKKRIAVKFQAKDKKPTCELYGCEIIPSKSN
jgi:uncharacterized protein